MKTTIYKKESSAMGLLNLNLLFLLFFIFSYGVFNNALLSLLLSIALDIFVFVLMNKKWFKEVVFYKDNLEVNYRYSFNGIKTDSWNYKDFLKVTYFDFMWRTPSHCRIDFSDKSKLRFNCSLKEISDLLDFLKKKGVDVNHYAQDKNNYR